MKEWLSDFLDYRTMCVSHHREATDDEIIEGYLKYESDNKGEQLHRDCQYGGECCFQRSERKCAAIYKCHWQSNQTD